MATKLRQLITPPVFADDEDKTRSARLLNATLWAVLALLLTAMPILLIFSDRTSRVMTAPPSMAMLMVTGWLLRLSHRGRVRLASLVLSSALLLIITFALYTFGGIRSPMTTGYLFIIVLVGFLMGGREALIFGCVSMLAAVGLFFLEASGRLPLPPDNTINPGHLITLFSVTGLLAVLLHYALRDFGSALSRAREHERSLAQSNRELATRSHDLERRTMQLQAAAEVSRTAISVHNPDVLLSQATHLIGERFGFYHVGIFLLDEAGEYAVLRAASSDGGRQMLANGHKLKVGEQGVVGYVAGSGLPRIALDVGADAVYFDNPLLPETRSEMALPLKIGERVIGVLDVQSRQEAAFDQQDAVVLQTMADQLAIAIENARLLYATQQAVRALGSATAEILAASTQQASGAAEQSAAISQTTAIVEEVRTISEQAIKRAQNVVEASQRTVEISTSGQGVVVNTIAKMEQIKTRVESIAQNILALSEQILQIGQIIATVSDIAAQSKMLALNAAVEAARAGEQGKGFAVVAAEIRRLAEQSRKATSQVKAILSSIQKATTATVKVTEEGTKEVDRGVQLATQAGQVIQQLAGVIDESAHAAIEAVTDGWRQTSGVEQIAQAMQSINKATVQSLASTRQVEKAAQDLSSLAHTLAEIVEQYRL